MKLDNIKTMKLIESINPHYTPSDPFQTHSEFLISLLKSSQNQNKKLIELGCGYGSTSIMKYFLESENKKFNSLSSYESSHEWIEKMKKVCKETITHNYNIVSNWNNTIDQLEKELKDDECFLIFVDMSPWEARSYSIKKLINKTDFIILHDSDYFPNNNIFGKVISKIIDENNPGERDYSDLLCNYKEYFPRQFAYRTGPPTLILSKKYSCEGFFLNETEK